MLLINVLKELKNNYFDIIYKRILMMYDFLVVGSGLFGSVFANRAKSLGYFRGSVKRFAQISLQT